jgi:hypothetical protein
VTNRKQIAIMLLCVVAVTTIAFIALVATTSDTGKSGALKKAVSEYKRGQYRSAIDTLDSIAPEYLEKQKCQHIKSDCLLNLSHAAAEQGNDSNTLELLSGISSNFPLHEEVAQLRKQAENSIAAKIETERSIQAAKMLAERQIKEEQTKRGNEWVESFAGKEEFKRGGGDSADLAAFMKAMDIPNSILLHASQSGDRLTVFVGNDWHYQPYQTRLQISQNLWGKWASIHSPNDLDISRLKVTDANGNKVGGSRFLAGSLIWVKK